MALAPSSEVQDQIVTVARAMFDNYLPAREWDNPLFDVDRTNCLFLAVQFREIFLRGVQSEPVQLWAIPSEQGIDDRWRQSFVKGKFADVLAELTGTPLAKLDAEDRAWLKGQADQLVDDAVTYFEAPMDDGSQYQPQDEPEYQAEGGQ